MKKDAELLLLLFFLFFDDDVGLTLCDLSFLQAKEVVDSRIMTSDEPHYWTLANNILQEF